MATESNKGVFMGALFNAVKEKRHVDIKLKPGGDGDDGVAIHAHKLAARSKVFGDMIESVGERNVSRDETITLSELKHEELEAFLEFTYVGYLPDSKLKRHAGSLYIAADKYEIPHLRDVCRDHFISSLESSNALDVVELSGFVSDKALRDAALDFTAKHAEEVVFSVKFKAFVERNPTLAADVTRACVKESMGSLGALKASLKEAEASLAQIQQNMIRRY